MRLTYIFTLLFALLFVAKVFAEETTLEIEQDSPNLKKAEQTAVEQVSLELMERFIESSKLKEQKKQIQKIISTYSNRYILSTKTGKVLKKEDKSFIIPVTIGFSEANLKKILLEEDLFYSGTSHLRILPLILYENIVEHESYGWWKRKKPPSLSVKTQVSELYSQIQQVLLSYGFFLIHPEWASAGGFIPKELQFRTPKKAAVFKLSQFFQSHLVMTGFIKVRETSIDSLLNVRGELTVYHADNGRLLAEVERSAKIPKLDAEGKPIQPLSFFLKKHKDFAKGIGVQLKSIYSAGQISSRLLKLTVKGELSYRNADRFRKLLISEVKEIKDLQENIILSKSLTYVANTDSSIEELSKKIKNANFPGFYVRVSRVRKSEIVLRAIPKE